MNEVVKLERHDVIAIVTVNSPPVNALSAAVRGGIFECMKSAIADAEVKAIVLTCGGRTFIAGADITEFGKPPKPPGLAEVLVLMENSPKPIIAAIHGTALGGGLEVALACHYRVATKEARLGLPEVKLGLLPGAGGTQRLPRAVGPELAVKMIVSGDPIGAAEALKNGLIEEIVEGPAAGGEAFARKVLAEKRPLRKLRDDDSKLAAAKADISIFTNAVAALTKKARGLEAPFAAADAVRAAIELPFDEGLKKEREGFLKLVSSDQSKAQRYAFFSEREAAKIAGVPEGTKPRPVERVAIIGAGTMGGGIAMSFANAGIPVTLIETSEEQLKRGMGVMQKNYEATAARGGIPADAPAKRMGLITGVVGLENVKDADLVIEAVFETMAVKKEVFEALDKHAKPGAVLASNTSYLNIDEIAKVTKRPQDVLGMHFFSPANVMKLCEIVRADKTAPDALTTAVSIARKIAKVPAVVGVCDGFVGNRMLAQRGKQSEKLLFEGALPQQVDAVVTKFGMPMGPFAMSDLAGLDIGWRSRKDRGIKSEIADALCEAGRFGQKTGKGYYKYEAGSRAALPDPEVEKLIDETLQRLGRKKRVVSDDEILERMMYPMINEGARILEENIAARPSDIDVIWLYGYGWPIYRGGPMFYADQVGLKHIADRLSYYAKETNDPSLEPAPCSSVSPPKARPLRRWPRSRRRLDGASRRAVLSGKASAGTTRSRAARCPTCCRQRSPSSASRPAHRIPRPADQLQRTRSAGGDSRQRLPSRRLRQEQFGRAVPRQFAGSSRQFLRRAEGRRPRRASVAARRRDRAVAQAHGLRRAGAGHQQPLGAAADRAEIPRQGPARSPDRLRGRSLGQGRNAADGAAGSSAIVTYKQFTDGATKPAQWPAISADDVALLQYTGGTTGLAEGRDAQPRQSDVGGVGLRRLGQAGARRAQRDRARDLRAAAVSHLRADGGAALRDPARPSDLAAPTLRCRSRHARHRGQARDRLSRACRRCGSRSPHCPISTSAICPRWCPAAPAARRCRSRSQKSSSAGSA